MGGGESLNNLEEQRTALGRECERQAERLLQQLLPHEEAAGFCASVMGELATLAADRGDPEAVRSWGEQLEMLPGDHRAAAIKVYYRGNELADPAAADRLAVLTAQEQHEAQAELADGMISHPLSYSLLMPGIELVTQDLADRRRPADAWIAQQAIEPAHAWTLWREYYQNTLEATESQTNDHPHAEQAAQIIVHMVLDPNTLLDDKFLLAAIEDMWPSIRSTETRQTLLRTLMEVSERCAFSLDFYRQLAQMSTLVFSDLRIINSDIVQWFGDSMIPCADLLRKSGEYPVAFALPWRAALAMGRDVQRSKDILQVADAWITQIHQSPMSDDLRQLALVQCDPNYYLHYYARHYAALGDLEDAVNLTAAISSERHRLVATRECLAYARTVEQVQLFMPSEAALAINPQLAYQIEAVMVLRTGDTAAMTAKAHALLDIKLASGSQEFAVDGTIQGLIQSVYSVDQGAAHALADELCRCIEASPNPDYTFVIRLISQQMRYNPDLSLRIKYLSALERVSDPSFRLNGLLTIAKDLSAPDRNMTTENQQPHD